MPIDLKIKPILWLAAALLLLPLMISNDSLWIDESQTAAYAGLPNLREVIQRIESDNKTGSLSEGLMPLSMFLAWVFAQVLGTSEWALRAPNIIYLAAGFVFIWRVGVASKTNHLVLLFALQPFLWYYADEARPYALQIALGCTLLWSFLKIVSSQGTSLAGCVGFLISGLLLCASSLLCIVPVAATGLVLMGRFVGCRWKLQRMHLIAAATFLPLFLLLGFFYLHALQATGSGEKLWAFSISNTAYAFYEILGFQGLGPSRSALRDAARENHPLWSSFAPHAIPLIGFILAWLLVAAAAVRAWRRNLSSSTAALALVLLLSLAGFIVIGLVMKFPFWGRHLSPLLAFATALTLLICHQSTNRLRSTVLVTILGLFWAWSSANVRLSPRFANDDYRGAVAFAKLTSRAGEETWWAADTRGANYYGLHPVFMENPANTPPPVTPVFCHSVRNNTMEYLQSMPEPKWVVITKPDIYDNNGQITAFLQIRNYKMVKSFTSFHIWSR